jgi:hypothetical protein
MWFNLDLYIPFGKDLKCTYEKWACIFHLELQIKNYGWSKVHKSKCQFDSRPLKLKKQKSNDLWLAFTIWQ